MGGEELVGFAEMAVAEEAGVGGERRRVGGFEDEVLSDIDERLLTAGVATPKEEDEVVALFVEVFNRGFGEGLPALAAVRAGFVGFDRENIVEHEDALVLPGFKIAGFISMMTVLSVNFFVNIDERGRDRLRVGDGKGEAVGGARRVIGILAEDDDLNLMEIGRKSAKNIGLRREDGLSFVGLVEELAELLKIGLRELRIEKFFPTFVHSVSFPACGLS